MKVLIVLSFLFILSLTKGQGNGNRGNPYYSQPKAGDISNNVQNIVMKTINQEILGSGINPATGKRYESAEPYGKGFGSYFDNQPSNIVGNLKNTVDHQVDDLLGQSNGNSRNPYYSKPNAGDIGNNIQNSLYRTLNPQRDGSAIDPVTGERYEKAQGY